MASSLRPGGLHRPTHQGPAAPAESPKAFVGWRLTRFARSPSRTSSCVPCLGRVTSSSGHKYGHRAIFQG